MAKCPTSVCGRLAGVRGWHVRQCGVQAWGSHQKKFSCLLSDGCSPCSTQCLVPHPGMGFSATEFPLHMCLRSL